MRSLWQDLRYGVRMLTKRPGFTAVVVFTLGLGIGANTAIFSVVNAVLLRPLPFKDPDQLVQVQENHEQWKATNVTYASFLDLEGHSRALKDIAAYREWTFNLTDGAEPEQVEGALVSANFFPALGVLPQLGRFFLSEEDQPGSEGVVVISYGLWRRRFGSDPNLIGKTVKVNDVTHTVVGVMPPNFDFPGKANLWAPLVAGGSLKENRRSHLLTVIARLKPGMTIAQAGAEMSTLAQQIERQNPGVDPGFGIRVTGLQQTIVASIRPALIILFGAVGFVLLIACANVANLLLARAAVREKEMAIRAALGAGQFRLVRQLLTESVLLALLGGSVGLLLATWILSLITALSPADLPRLDEVSINGQVFAFTLLVSLLTGILFGLAPALQTSKFSLTESLKEGGRSSVGGGRRHLRNLLVVSEVALALVLLVGAGLLVNSFARLLRVDPGFNPNNLLTMYIFLSSSKYPQEHQRVAFIKQILERIEALPGVRSAGVANTLPITGGVDTDFEIEGRPAPTLGEEPSADIQIIDPHYLRTMGIPLLKGRAFTERDTTDAPKVMVISETMARRFWPDQDPIGKHVTMKDWGPPLTGEIVGVVGDVKADGLDSELKPMIYWPYTQFPQIFNHIVVRTAGDPRDMVAAVKGQIWSVDKEQPVASIRTMEQVLSDSVARRRFNMLLLGIFAAVSMVLASVGIYGVISHSVAQRTREIGIRMALGAERRDVLKLVMVQGMILTLIGVAVGITGALVITRVMASLLYGVSATDPETFVGVSLLLTAVALVACFIPARRATKVDPMVALRYE